MIVKSPSRKRGFPMAKIRKNGRGAKHDRYVELPHYIMGTFAWSRLSVTARAAWLEFARVHNGSNNGLIGMPEKTLGERLGVSHDTARRAINDLVTFGFLERTKAPSFKSSRRAAEYLMTHIPDDRTQPKGIASRAFQNIGKVSRTGNGLDSGEGLKTTEGEAMKHPLSQRSFVRI
jgi:hypothetical protein